jgi:hypothetical protein
MSNITELLTELATVAPDVCGKGNFGRIKIGEYEFEMQTRPFLVDGKPIKDSIAEALLVDALAAECRRRGWSYSSDWSKKLGYCATVYFQEFIACPTSADAFLTAFIAAYKSQSSAAS